MIGEDRREEIERSIENLRYDREVLRELYHQVDGIVPEENLSDIVFEIHLTEMKIETLRKKLPPPMSQRQLRALEEIPKAWAEVTGKKIGDKYHTKESWAEWQQRNIVDPKLIDKIRRVAFKEAPVTDLQDHIGAMFTLDWYSPEVATAYVKATKQAEQAYQEMLDKAHKEALNEALHRELWARFDKDHEATLATLSAEKTLREHAVKEAAGMIFIDDDNVAHVNGTIKTPRMVIEEAPMRRGLTIKEWFQKWCK